MVSSKGSTKLPVSDACLAVFYLSRIKGLGLKNFHLLYNYFSSIERILQASYQELVKSGVKPGLAELIEKQEKIREGALDSHLDRFLSWADKQHNYIVCLEDELYPDSLKEIYNPPPLLYLQGQVSALENESIAIVGSRRPTLTGQKHARGFAKQLAEMGYCITSGLAIGIDSHAHRGAVDVEGVSCAVLGCGLGHIYPKQNQKLALDIQERGLLISELGLDVSALPANFPRRNRIIAGLSQATLVIEAGLKSGSLITAEFALEQNREVLAIPGPIDNPLSKGGHSLIKQGATLVDDIEDIINAIGSKNNLNAVSKEGVMTPPPDYSDLSLEEQKIISVLGHQSTPFDDLLHCLGMDVGELNNLLVILELKGVLCSVAGGYQRV